jgi:hypothetical protein
VRVKVQRIKVRRRKCLLLVGGLASVFIIEWNLKSESEVQINNLAKISKHITHQVHL